MRHEHSLNAIKQKPMSVIGFCIKSINIRVCYEEAEEDELVSLD
jgi:hypothetical protein